MFLLIDNFDSFTFNVVQVFQQQGRNPIVKKNDDPEILAMATSPDLEMVCISPGPSRPENAGLCLDFLAKLPKTVPVLGVCLGHQILGHFAGAPVVVADRIMHGKTSDVNHREYGLFGGLPNPMQCCRYHSLVVKAEKAPKLLEITAWTDQNEVMGLRYKDRPWVGVQFHPESVLTPDGPKLMANFPGNLVK
ncbi:anthranilate synthase component II [Desulfovibrio inopinatus]|uniref:anthranilate synthase component II n=1 Tax=Desulfovibrio inopinatus TaxID=102109 RepID=UPI000408A8F4|nr:aminodeoxychorismate/anthranilate synthase component II [Desulfovibrio inopinatus]